MNTLLKNEYLTVNINLMGAEMCSITDHENNEYLWNGDALYWNEQAPVLFPYIARLTDGCYTFDGGTYSMAIHGIAKYKEFRVAALAKDTAALILSSDDDTLRQYPWNFLFKITYQLEDRTIKIKYEVTNQTEKTMYFGIGSHPGFCIPNTAGCSFEDYYLEFEENISPIRIGFSEDCFVTKHNEDYKLRENRYLDLRHELFDQDAIVLKNAGSCVSIKNKKNRKSIRISYDTSMTYLGIWHTPHTKAPYICIEPWSSLPSIKGEVADLATQKDLISLEAGGTYKTEWSIKIE